MHEPSPERTLLELDERLCVRFNQAARFEPVRQLLRFASRLGNGVFWYALMGAILASRGTAGLQAVLHMAAVGLSCTLLYKWLKTATSRPRPYQVNLSISCNARPLDPFSFPSGHTLHAVAFTIVALSYFPQLSWLLIPLTSLIALSRVVLGLHYPSDVLAGTFIGAVVAGISLYF